MSSPDKRAVENVAFVIQSVILGGERSERPNIDGAFDVHTDITTIWVEQQPQAG